MLVYCFNKNSVISLSIMISINFLFEVCIAKMDIFYETYLYKACILRYFAALGLGMYISKDMDIKSKRNLFIILLLPFSLIYIYNTINNDYIFPGVVEYSWHFQNIFAVFYPAFVMILTINYIKVDNKFLTLIKKIGENSFNMFLFQILYFSFGLSTLDNIVFRFIDTNNLFIIFIIYLICFIFDMIVCYIGAKKLKNLCDKKDILVLFKKRNLEA